MKYYTILISFIFSQLFSATITIPVDYSTIQEGINESSNGDTVLVQPGIYYENLYINKEITVMSTADFESLFSIVDWHENDIINMTVINGSVLTNPRKRSCLVIRDGDIQPEVKGFTFEGGIGTKMLIMDCGEGGGIQRSEFTGGGILVYDAYPTINYNRFVGNGFTPPNERAGKGAKTGGAIAHYEDAEVEFDEDRSEIPESNHSNIQRTVPGVIDIKNNYFEGNSSGNGQGFFSLGFEGAIDLSNSVFENIDCGTNTVNDYVLNSSENLASFSQDGITGTCIEETAFYVATTGNNTHSGSEDYPFATIAHALSFVKNTGDPTTIHVAAGTYSTNTTGEIFPIVIPDNVHIIGENRESTILDADADATDEAAVVIIKEVEDVTFKNFTLANGYTEGHGCIGGGGLLVTSDNMFDISEAPVVSTPIIENLIIENSWSHNGGGISFFLVDGPVLSNIIVRNNESTFHGGGIFVYVSNVVMSDLIVTGNRNYGNPNLFNVGHGGGIMSVASGVDITNLLLTNNLSVTMGGGIFHMGNSMNNTSGFPGFTINGGLISDNEGYFGGGMSFYDGADPVLDNVEIRDNFGENAGGGVHMDGANPFFNNCIIKGNMSPQGGGVFVYGSSYPRIENSTLQENDSEEGGAIYYKQGTGGLIRNSLIFNNTSTYEGGISIASGDVSIINCTITGNTATTDGGVVTWGGNAIIANSIIWGNQPNSLAAYDGYDNSDIDLMYSNTSDAGWDGDQNININPLFMNPATSDYTLQENSPCIDAGTAELTTHFPSLSSSIPGFSNITDYTGEAPDMGAFEVALTVEPPSSITSTPLVASIMLLWTNVSTSYTYKIEKSINEDFSTPVQVIFVDQNSYLDNDVQPGVEYFYRITSLYGDSHSVPSQVISAMISVMDVIESDNIPNSYSLKQNYPNPFNPITTLKYGLPEDSFVSIIIYNLKGNVINELVNTKQSSGFHSISWNATNNLGQPVSAGMYIYTIQAGNFRETRKMILLK